MDYTGNMSDQSLKEKVYKVEARVEAISELQQDIKGYMKSMATDIKKIGEDIHHLSIAAAAIEPLQEIVRDHNEDIEDLKKWKAYMVAAISVGIAVMGTVEVLVNLYIK